MKVFTKEEVLQSLDSIIETFDEDTLKKAYETETDDNKELIDKILNSEQSDKNNIKVSMEELLFDEKKTN